MKYKCDHLEPSPPILEPEGEGARGKILEYEKDRANAFREELQTEDKHKRP